jgi:ferric-dicitrate binding protein FerR (iron transport regulator)
MIDDDSKELDCSEHIRFKPVETNPEAIYTRVQYRIWEEEWRNANGSVLRRWRYVSIAVSIAFLALLSYHFYSIPEPDIVQVSLSPVIYLETAAFPGTKTCITLPDSSIVWLNSMASLRYPQQFPDDHRMVELRGEAFFDIQEDATTPFVVSTDGMRIHVTGTVFNVYSGLTPGYCTEITLIEGSVSLYKDGNTTPVADHILMPNQQALFDKESGDLHITEVNASAYSSWVTRKFVFDKTSMKDIARELERAFNVKIHINNDSIRNMQLNAHFTHGESLDKILSILQIPTNYTYRKENGGIYIK